jgi:uncharacterized protein YlxP (DUF503 family)
LTDTLVALGRFDLRILGCHSLKQKRHVVKGLTEAIRSKFAVSVAEVDHQDLWQRTTLAVAVVGAQEYHLRKVMSSIESLVEAWGGVEAIEVTVSLHSPQD